MESTSVGAVMGTKITGEVNSKKGRDGSTELGRAILKSVLEQKGVFELSPVIVLDSFRCRDCGGGIPEERLRARLIDFVEGVFSGLRKECAADLSLTCVECQEKRDLLFPLEGAFHQSGGLAVHSHPDDEY